MRFRPGFRLLSLLALLVSASALWLRAELQLLALQKRDPLPEIRALLEQDRYADASRHLSYFMQFDYVALDPEAQQLQLHIDDTRKSFAYKSGKISEGLRTGQSDETIGRVAGIATDLFVIGDIRDLGREAGKWTRGEQPDNVILGLSSLGLAATSAQVVTTLATISSGGAAAPTVAGSSSAKLGTSMLKLARKSGNLPAWLSRTIVDTAKQFSKTKDLGHFPGIVDDAAKLARTDNGLELLGATRSAGDLRRAATFAEVYGDHSTVLIKLGGNDMIRLANRIPSHESHVLHHAAIHGREGLRLLERTGVYRYTKALSRVSKITYKHDILPLLINQLLRLPTWSLFTVLILSGLGLLPRRYRYRTAVT